MYFIKAMGSEYTKSKAWQKWSFIAVIFLYLLTASEALNLKLNSTFVILIAFVFQIASFYFRAKSSQHFNTAEEIRRLAMLQDGLGETPPSNLTARIVEKTGCVEKKSDSPSEYYESKLPVGPNRLIEIIEECLFFTNGTSRSTAHLMLGGTIVGALLFLFIFIVAVDLGFSSLGIVSKIFVMTLAFWTTGDLLTMFLRFNALSKTTEILLNRCSHLENNKKDLTREALIIFDEYNCSVVQAPPMPEFIYNWRRNKLNVAWKNRKALSSNNG